MFNQDNSYLLRTALPDPIKNPTHFIFYHSTLCVVLLAFITVCDCFICLIAFCLSLPLEPNFHESEDLPVSLIVMYLASSLQYLALSKHPVFVKLMNEWICKYVYWLLPQGCYKH